MCDQVPTPGRRLVNGQIQTLANRLHISPSKIIRRANIGPTISTQRLGCSRWPNVGRTLACQLRRSTNHVDHVPTLDQRLVPDWDIMCYYKLFLYYNLCLSVMLDSLCCSFTFISFVTTGCSFTIICVEV